MIDRNDPTWAEIETEIKARLTEAVAALKNKAVDWNEVQFERGRIAAFEDLLNLPETSPVVDAADPGEYF